MRVKIGNYYWAQGYTMNGETVPVKAKLVELIDDQEHLVTSMTDKPSAYDCVTQSLDGIRMYDNISELRETRGEVWADIKREDLETEEAEPELLDWEFGHPNIGGNQ